MSNKTSGVVNHTGTRNAFGSKSSGNVESSLSSKFGSKFGSKAKSTTTTTQNTDSNLTKEGKRRWRPGMNKKTSSAGGSGTTSPNNESSEAKAKPEVASWRKK